MYIEQLYTGCLAQATYYIESGGEVAVIDPMREPQPYIDLALKRGAVIRFIFETHFHADFVSGHLDLARLTGAKIIFGPGARAGYEIHTATDGEEFKLGFIALKVLHTPGHTPESSCFLLLDERHNPHSVFTGDTLFAGDVGRPDIPVESDKTISQRAGILYDSIETKLLPLPNYVVVYPGHGAGSACGKSIGAEPHSTIGLQKQSNYALQAQSRAEFISVVTDGLTEQPKYFAMDAAINRKGYTSLADVLQKNLVPIQSKLLKQLLQKGKTLVIDTRAPEVFEKGYIPGSIFIGLDGTFAGTAGSILDPEMQLVVVTEPGREREAIVRLARVGLENVTGYLDGGFSNWIKSQEPVETIKSISAEEFEERFSYNSNTAVDVREPSEWIPGFVAGAKLIELPKLEIQLMDIDRNKSCFVYCQTGYRSMVAASILKRNGFGKVENVKGGMIKIRETPISIKQLSSVVN